MNLLKLISSPTNFLVEPYSPGYTIDFQQPGLMTDLERFRQTFDFEEFNAIRSDAEFAAKAGRALVELGVAEDEADFAASLHSYTNRSDLDEQLLICLQRLGVHTPVISRAHSLELLFKRTHCLAKNVNYPVRLHCHVSGNTTVLEDSATHYGYVLDGLCVAVEKNRTVVLSPNTFFCISGGASIVGSGRCVVVTRFNFIGITQYGGEIEDWGRLKYIDGCTDTLLVPPLKKGDPCYNALYFPHNIEQTQHVHPSLRCGLVVGGEGICKTPFGDHELKKGSIFFLPPETYHSFHTYERSNSNDRKSALTVIAFHPDSDFGPTDTDHPMVNRTYFKFLHRITSAQKESKVHDVIDALG